MLNFGNFKVLNSLPDRARLARGPAHKPYASIAVSPITRRCSAGERRLTHSVTCSRHRLLQNDKFFPHLGKQPFLSGAGLLEGREDSLIVGEGLLRLDPLSREPLELEPRIREPRLNPLKFFS